MTKYTEIFKLRDKLDAIDLEHEFEDRTEECLGFEHYRIKLFNEKGNKIADITQGCSLKEEDKLLLVENNSVIGLLSADDVFERIMNYYGSREKL